MYGSVTTAQTAARARPNMSTERPRRSPVPLASSGAIASGANFAAAASPSSAPRPGGDRSAASASTRSAAIIRSFVFS